MGAEYTLDVNGINCGGCKKTLVEAFTAADIEIVSIATKGDSGGHPNKVVVKAASLDAAKEAIAAADKGRGKYTIEESTAKEEGHGHEHAHAEKHDHAGGGCCGKGHGEHDHGHAEHHEEAHDHSHGGGGGDCCGGDEEMPPRMRAAMEKKKAEEAAAANGHEHAHA